MRKHYFTILTAALLLPVASVCANAGDVKDGDRVSTLPEAVLNFLDTGAGKAFTARQFAAAQAKAEVPVVSKASGLKYEAVLSEDFSKWTAGAENAPDAADIAEDSISLQQYMNMQGGWTGLYAYQAGGTVYFGSDAVHGPGYLKTPSIDLRGSQGVYRIKMRARTADANHVEQMLQIFSLDEGASSIINAQAMPFGQDWTDLEWLLSGGAEKTSILLYGNSGNIYVDDLTIEKVTYPLNTPKITQVTLEDANVVKVKLQPVEGATSYYLYAQDSDADNKVVAQTTVTAAEAVLNFLPEDGTYYKIYAVAKGSEGDSYAASWWGKLAPEAVGEPVALAATNITDNGFTANWERGVNAAKTILAVTQKHVATVDNEPFVIFDDDFSSLSDATEENPVTVAQMGYCDKYFKRSGWYGDVVAGFGGMIAITNSYASYGLVGSITSPAMNYGIGGGKISVSAKVQSYVDDAVLSVAFMDGNAKVGEQTVDVGTQGSTFSIDLNGGKEGYKLCISIKDAAESGDFIFIDDLKISGTMNKGESITLPYTSFYVPYPATSYDVSLPLTGEDNATYTVQGYFSDELKSGVSDEVTVKRGAGIGYLSQGGCKPAVIMTADGISFCNPGHAAVCVYTADGRMVASFKGISDNVNVPLRGGIYIVRIGGETFKVSK